MIKILPMTTIEADLMNEYVKRMGTNALLDYMRPGVTQGVFQALIQTEIELAPQGRLPSASEIKPFQVYTAVEVRRVEDEIKDHVRPLSQSLDFKLTHLNRAVALAILRYGENMGGSYTDFSRSYMISRLSEVRRLDEEGISNIGEKIEELSVRYHVGDEHIEQLRRVETLCKVLKDFDKERHYDSASYITPQNSPDIDLFYCTI
ncbi:hypothetical protein M1437_03590 [Patescibacteria group bacterium]|nr:hypothetical protein [Patescibacteria group bacterium]